MTIHRLVDEYNSINKYIVASFFWWTILAISSTMIILEIQLVEYSLNLKKTIISPKIHNSTFNRVRFHILFKSEHTTNPIFLATEGCLVFWSFVVVLLFCVSGEMVTYQFNMYNEVLNKVNWYTFPVEMQQMLVIFMSITQSSTFIRGYGNIVCTRDSFKQVSALVLFTITAF